MISAAGRCSKGAAQKRIQHPYYQLEKKKNGKGYIRGRANKKSTSESFTQDEVLDSFYSFVDDLSNQKCCTTIENKACKCNCLRFLKVQLEQLFEAGSQRTDLNERMACHCL